MNKEKRGSLYVAYEAFMNRSLHQIPIEGIEQFIHDNIMGFGTTVQEEVYDAKELVEYIRLQEDQGQSTFIIQLNA